MSFLDHVELYPAIMYCYEWFLPILYYITIIRGILLMVDRQFVELLLYLV